MRALRLPGCILTVFIIFFGACKDGRSAKMTQYYRQGEQLYTKNCSNCHQKDGSGLRQLYPPVDKSDFIDNNLEAVLCLMRNGISGPIVVNGKKFNQPMPAQPMLTDLEIAEIATYLYNSWGRNRGIIEVREVTAKLQTCEPIN